MQKLQAQFSVPVTASVDVAVAGGGPAGVVAALAAARNGAEVLLIERVNYLGGNMTGGLINSLHGYRMHQNYMGGLPMSNWTPPLMVRGISLEILERLQDANGTLYPEEHYGDPSVRENFDGEILIGVLDEMMEEAGVTVLLNAHVFGAIREGGAVTGLYVAGKSGPQAILAKVVVDCTGDGDIAAFCGADYAFGRADTHVTHGVSLQMEIGGIDPDRLLGYLKNRPALSDRERAERTADIERLTNGGGASTETAVKLDGTTGAFTMGGKPQTWADIDRAREEGRYLMIPATVEGEWIQYVKDHPEMPYMPGTSTLLPCYPRAPKINWFGLVRQGKIRYDQVMSGVFELFVDQRDDWALSQAAALMRKINRYYMDFFRTRIPGFEDAYILKTSPIIGTRESRRIVGEYTLTAEDCVNGARFDDVVAICGRACNVHNMTGQFGLWYWLEPNAYYDLPYRILVPEKVDNLLVAGRCSSVDFIALGATRGMPTCMSLGEAAGTAAAVAVRDNVTPRAVDIPSLQAALREQGVLLAAEE